MTTLQLRELIKAVREIKAKDGIKGRLDYTTQDGAFTISFYPKHFNGWEHKVKVFDNNNEYEEIVGGFTARLDFLKEDAINDLKEYYQWVLNGKPVEEVKYTALESEEAFKELEGTNKKEQGMTKEEVIKKLGEGENQEVKNKIKEYVNKLMTYKVEDLVNQAYGDNGNTQQYADLEGDKEHQVNAIKSGALNVIWDILDWDIMQFYEYSYDDEVVMFESVDRLIKRMG